MVFLGIPLVAGFLTRTLGERARGQEWYETMLLPRIAPIALYGLLFTVVVLFALQGKTITSQPLNVARSEANGAPPDRKMAGGRARSLLGRRGL